MSANHHRLVGNSLHVLNLINIGLYGSMLYAYGSRERTIFDQAWLQGGFCTPHDDVDYHTTHDYSGHAMLVMSLLGLALMHFLNNHNHQTTAAQKLTTKANNLAFWGLVGALGHAWGHYFIAFARRNDFYPPGDQTFLDDLRNSSPLVAFGKAFPGYPFFWIPLVKTYMMNTARDRVAVVALVFWLGSLFMQVRFGFAYAQSVLFAGMSLDQLMLPKTDKEGIEYALWPLITTIPNGIFAWIECLTCSSSFLMRNHGHVIYDVYMASSYTLFYLLCWLRANNYSNKTKAL